MLKMQFKLKQFPLFYFNKNENNCTSQLASLFIFVLVSIHFDLQCTYNRLKKQLACITSQFQSQATLMLLREDKNEASSLAEK